MGILCEFRHARSSFGHHRSQSIVTPMSADDCEHYARAILNRVDGPTFEQYLHKSLWLPVRSARTRVRPSSSTTRSGMTPGFGWLVRRSVSGGPYLAVRAGHAGSRCRRRSDPREPEVPVLPWLLGLLPFPAAPHLLPLPSAGGRVAVIQHRCLGRAVEEAPPSSPRSVRVGRGILHYFRGSMTSTKSAI